MTERGVFFLVVSLFVAIQVTREMVEHYLSKKRDKDPKEETLNV